jgi:signal transduction histidine kinase
MGKQNRFFPAGKKVLFTIFSVFLSFLFAQVRGDTLPDFVEVSSPVNSDLKFITFFSSESGLACGKQILIYKNGRWEKYTSQPPVSVDLIFPLDTNSFFITSRSQFQESELYYSKDGHWKKRWHPLANSILSMYFTDSINGVITAPGEVAILKNNHWIRISPPGNRPVNNVFIDRDSAIWTQVDNTGIFKYNKGKWLKIKDSDQVKYLNYKNDTVFVLANNFYGYIDDNNTIKILSGRTDLIYLRSFMPISKNEAIAVGTNGLILHYINGRWEQLESGVNEDLHAIWVLPDGSCWIAGNDGLLLTSGISVPGLPDISHWKGFKEVPFNSFAKVIDDEYGVVAADFDNDGLTDIFTCGLFEANHLYINLGSNNFVDKARHWNMSGEESINFRELNLGACAADFDNNGYEDLYVSSLNGKNKLYKNIRGDHFVDYSEISQGTGDENDRTNSVISGDVDNDGDVDLFITNENSSNRLYLNNGAGIFSEDITETAGLATDFGGMGCCFGDIDNDGDLDLYVANWSAKNILYRNLLKETGQLVFKIITDKAGVGGENYTKSNAVVFADIDNDSDLDLFVTNRKTSNKLYLNDGKGIFTDVTASFLGIDTLKSYGAVIIDFDGDGYKDIYISNVGRNTFYKNINGERFVDNTLKYGAGIEGYSTGSAAADFDNDGYTDIYVANYIGKSSILLHNNHTGRQFIQANLKCYENNRDGTGTKLWFFNDGGLNNPKQLISYMEISGGSGYASMSQRFLPVSVPGKKFVDIKVIFPSGEIKTFEHIQTGKPLIVNDVEGWEKNMLITEHWWTRQVRDPYKLIKLLSWLIVILLVVLAVIRGYKRYAWTWGYSTVFIVFLILIFYFQSGYFEYKNIWLSSIFPVLSVLLLILLVHLYFERRNIKTQALTEQERIRENLSRDLHDDLASTISTIAIYLTLIRYNLKKTDKKVIELLDKTMVLSGNASTAITDLVWAIKPKPESLNNLITRINSNFSVLFKEQGILFSVETGKNTDTIILNTKTKKNLYLIIKEALNNTLKYADAFRVKIEVNYQKPEIILLLKDDGNGFDVATAMKKGHGLSNMKKRAQEMDGQLEITSATGRGTKIKLRFKPD